MFDEILNKIKQLNSGILNPDNALAHLGMSKCLELWHLSTLLGAGIKDFNTSNKTDSDLRELSSLVNETENKTNALI